jgi:flagellar biosynthesis/type III secretory pathway protein FliH
MGGPDDPHDYDDCGDAACQRYPCVVFKQGYRKGWDDGYPEGYEDGFAAGFSAGAASCEE